MVGHGSLVRQVRRPRRLALAAAWRPRSDPARSETPAGVTAPAAGPRAAGGGISLAAFDPLRLRAFYLEVGWPIVDDAPDGPVFDVGPFLLEVVPIRRLADRAGTLAGGFRPGLRFAAAIRARNPHDVDVLVSRMAGAGAVVTQATMPMSDGCGRTATVADPEGNFWEISWRPPAPS